MQTVPGSTYGSKSGTSMATPHVAGGCRVESWFVMTLNWVGSLNWGGLGDFRGRGFGLAYGGLAYGGLPLGGWAL